MIALQLLAALLLVALVVACLLAVATAGDSRNARRVKLLREETPAHTHTTQITDEYGRTLP